MPVLDSRLDTAGAAFAANAQRMAERLAEVQRLEGLVIAESESKRERFEQRGQLLPRERIARLLDRGSGFLELSRLAGLGMHDDDGKDSVLGGGSIVGIGQVAGKRCVVLASDSAIKGGTIPPMGLKKSLRAQELARDNKLPLIYLVESGQMPRDKWSAAGFADTDPVASNDTDEGRQKNRRCDLIVVPSCKNGVTVGIDPNTAKGDIAPGDKKAGELWRIAKDTPDVPCPTLVNGTLFIWKESNNLLAYDAKTGKKTGELKVTNERHRASPVYADGKLIVVGREGTMAVVDPKPEPEMVGEKIKLPDTFTASPVVCGGRIYLRGWNHPGAIGTK